MTDQLDELCEMLKPDREIKIRSRGEWTIYDRHGAWLSHGTLYDLRDKLKTFRKDAAVKALLDAVNRQQCTYVKHSVARRAEDGATGDGREESRSRVYRAARALEKLL